MVHVRDPGCHGNSEVDAAALGPLHPLTHLLAHRPVQQGQGFTGEEGWRRQAVAMVHLGPKPPEERGQDKGEGQRRAAGQLGSALAPGPCSELAGGTHVTSVLPSCRRWE